LGDDVSEEVVVALVGSWGLAIRFHDERPDELATICAMLDTRML
jgi:hypothetical protein